MFRPVFWLAVDFAVLWSDEYVWGTEMELGSEPNMCLGLSGDGGAAFDLLSHLSASASHSQTKKRRAFVLR